MDDKGIDRRQFLKAGAVIGGGAIIGGGMLPGKCGRCGTESSHGATYRLPCTNETAIGGYWDNSLPPVLRIKSGDTVAVETGYHLMGKVVTGNRLGVLDQSVQGADGEVSQYHLCS